MKSFRELDVWNKAMELTDKVYDVVRPRITVLRLSDSGKGAVFQGIGFHGGQ